MSSTHIQKARQVQSKRSNVIASNSRTQFNNSHDQSDYEIVIQFQLRRERQKTRILQQRLHNKQIFIQQMKEYQDELTLAFQKCQQELISTKKVIQKYFNIQKDYQQEIAELKYLIIRLQDEINIRDVKVNQRNYSSVKKNKDSSPDKKRQVRSKTMMNANQESPRPLADPVQQQIIKDSKKISKFIKQFLMMAQCFLHKNAKQSLKNQLKNAWKWIKQVVKQWNDLKKLQQSYGQFLQKLDEKGKGLKKNQPTQIFNRILSLIQSK